MSICRTCTLSGGYSIEQSPSGNNVKSSPSGGKILFTHLTSPPGGAVTPRLNSPHTQMFPMFHAVEEIELQSLFLMGPEVVAPSAVRENLGQQQKKFQFPPSPERGICIKLKFGTNRHPVVVRRRGRIDFRLRKRAR